MPNLPAHIHLASQAASKLDYSTINRHLGSFLLGATAPDIRSMTKWRREETHFAPLEVGKVGEGVEGMFRMHPNLRRGEDVNGPTQAFVAGYINHLVADESWIIHVYHVYFDDHRAPVRQMQANIWDRAVQLEMDRVARVELRDMVDVRLMMESAEEGIDVDFISPVILTQWREWVGEFNSWGFSWDRLHRMVRRMYGDDGQAEEMASQFIQNLPGSLEQVCDHLPSDKIASYREGAVQSSVMFIKEYLDAVASDRGAGGS